MPADYQALFAKFNQRFFGGQLPHYRIQVVACITIKGALGRIARQQGVISGRHLPQSHVIQLRKLPRQKDMLHTLLHEMAHAATTGHHDARWRAEMRRLIKMGAPVLHADPIGRAPLTRALAREVAEEIFCSRWPKSARHFVHLLAFAHGCSQAYLLRQYPWVLPFFRTRQAQERPLARWVQRRSRELLTENKIRCTCGSLDGHSPNCHFELARDEAIDQARDEWYQAHRDDD